jgi:hypothetical protein
MEKPPFQFGLKAGFAAMTVIAASLSAGEVGRHFRLAVIGALAATLLLVFSVVAFLAAMEIISGMIRLARVVRNRARLRSEG